MAKRKDKNKKGDKKKPIAQNKTKKEDIKEESKESSSDNASGSSFLSSGIIESASVECQKIITEINPSPLTDGLGFNEPQQSSVEDEGEFQLQTYKRKKKREKTVNLLQESKPDSFCNGDFGDTEAKMKENKDDWKIKKRSDTVLATTSKLTESSKIGDGDACSTAYADFNTELTIPCRKSRSGTSGRPIVIETNHLALTLKNLNRAIHYDVAINPSSPKKLFRLVMEEFRHRFYPTRYPAFDGTKNLYSAQELPFGKHIVNDVTICEKNLSKTFNVVVKFANYVDFSPLHKFLTANPENVQHHLATPQEVMQCLDIVLRNAPSLTFLPVGRSYFTLPQGQILSLGSGMEIYFGFYQSAIIGWKPFLNIDVTHKAFPARMNVIDLILDLCNLTREELQRPLQKREEELVGRFLRQLKVRYEIPGNAASTREYRVNSIEKAANIVTFKTENGQEMTVERYYVNNKRVTLKFPYMPCLWVGNKEKSLRVLLPSELCSVVQGQTINRRLPEQITSSMIKQAATSTIVRKEKIMNSVRTAKFNEDPCVKEFGIEVSDSFLRINARVLDAPDLRYNGAKVKPSKGCWRPLKFQASASLSLWTVIALDTTLRLEYAEEFVKTMCAQASLLGMTISEPQRPFVNIQLTFKKELQELTSLFTEKKHMKLIFVIVPNSGPYYSYVKQAAELNVGCLTQCIRSKTIPRISTSTVINILQKVNAKLEGINHSFADREPWMLRPYMIMGADVTHPSPDSKDKTSIAAVTASYDPGCFRYNICYRLQPPKVEIIEDLEAITRDHLLYFYKNSNCFKPERILFFRDGVSEGQFTYVLNTEIQAIRRACVCLQPDGTYKPKITFLVVQKRHHTRFFPVDPKDASNDRNLNVPVGTCVDTEITHPTAIDFCLVSHASIQGVARPTKYRVLWDDADMSEDELERLSFYFCHMFSRCTHSVSYPAPTYYAHLAAARITTYTETAKLNVNNLKQEEKRLKIKDSILKCRPMFFI